jgi:hypothetical protein
VQESAGDAQTDALGLGDGGELVLLVGGDLDGAIQPLAEGLNLGLLRGEVPLKLVDPGSGRSTVHGLGDLLGLAVERLARLIAVVGQLGDVAISAAENREGTGDSLRDRGHEGSLHRGRSRDHTHDCTRLNGNCPWVTSAEERF